MPTAPALDLDHALAVARQAAEAAAVIMRRYYRAADLGLQIKPDETPVTRADTECEEAIRAVLNQAFPQHAIYGEEQGRSGEGEHLWLVDPIDGTKSFVRGYPMFSTQIALMVGDKLVLGVSSAPLYGQTLWARRGAGAFLDGRPLRVAQTADWASASISTGNIKSLSRGRGWQTLAELIQASNRIRGYGDFLHYHLLADASLDLVIESDLNILDIAALTVIVEEAGGVMSDLDGQPIGLQTRSVLAGTPALHGAALQRFAGWQDG